jgi:hypothetical protein
MMSFAESLSSLPKQDTAMPTGFRICPRPCRRRSHSRNPEAWRLTPPHLVMLRCNPLHLLRRQWALPGAFMPQGKTERRANKPGICAVSVFPLSVHPVSPLSCHHPSTRMFIQYIFF